jgi:predicted nucleotidyltransferase component of viral defense system
MIPKARILEIATNQGLLPTIVQKDYVIGWLLQSISRHPTVSKWVFKGGTCLKKCYFETYRFSEDLDFTIPQDQPLNADVIRDGLKEVMEWIESNCGLTFPRELLKIDEYENPRGRISYQVKIAFRGPLELPNKSLQRVKLDLTQDELIANKPCLREIHSE